MLRFQWDALRPGDRVVLHYPGDSELRLAAGVVAQVQTERGPNDIAIRVFNDVTSADQSATKLVRPARLTVHLLPLDGDEGCWRCDVLATRAAATDCEPDAAAADAAPSPTRRCWRCLEQFACPPEEVEPGAATWWLCERCHLSLIGAERRATIASAPVASATIASAPVASATLASTSAASAAAAVD